MKIGGGSIPRFNPYGVASAGVTEHTVGDPLPYSDQRAYTRYQITHPEEVTAPPALDSGPSLADQIAAIIAANGATGSPLGSTPQTVVLQPQGTGNMTVLIIVLVGLGVVYWYVKKHGVT